MRYTILAAAAFAAAFPAVASAQDSSYDNSPVAEAPDGTPAFGIEPYVGVMGGYTWYDNNETYAGIPQNRNDLEGTEIEGVLGVNVPLGPFFVGAEGNVAKGVEGDIDWRYGAAGRAGVRTGDSGMFYGKVGYEWVNFDRFGNDSRDFHAMTYGIGAEVGPSDIGLGGITGESGVRLRLEANTFDDFKSFRPMAGIVTHF